MLVNTLNKTTNEAILFHSLKKYKPENIIELDIFKLNDEMKYSIVGIFLDVDQEKAINSHKNVSIIKRIGEIELLKIYIVLLKYFLSSIRVEEKMSNLDMVELCKEYIAKYPYNSVKDFVLCLKNIKQGKYGIIYNRIDIPVFFSFVYIYEEKRSEFLENKHRLFKDLESSNQNILNKCPDYVLEKYDSMINSIPNASSIKEDINRIKKLKELYKEVELNKML